MFRRSILSIVFLFAVKGEAQTLSISPKAPAPGALVRLSLRPALADTILKISGMMSGEPLHFVKSASGSWRAIGPITVDATGEIEASAIIEKASGALDTVRASVTIPKPPPPRRGARPPALSVSPRFTRPLDSQHRRVSIARMLPQEKSVAERTIQRRCGRRRS